MDRETAPVRIAVFGNGFSRKVMLPCLRHVDGARVVGLASPSQDRARETADQFGIPEVAADHREILERTRPDLVLVTTPPHRHLDQTRDALDAGCHVLCEKPTALSGAESAQMLELARARPDRLTVIDHELRFDPRRRLLREWIATGRFGRILHASYRIQSPGLRDGNRPWSWWFDAARGGGTLGALGSHAVDSLRVLLGEVEGVQGRLGTAHPTRPDPETDQAREVTADEMAFAWLRFRSGASAEISLSPVEAVRLHRMTVAGTGGWAQLDEQGPLLAAFGDQAPEEIGVDDDLSGNAELEIPDTDWARSFLRFARQIVRTLQSGESRVALAADFEDGHRNQQVLDAIRAANAAAAWIPVESAR